MRANFGTTLIATAALALASGCDGGGGGGDGGSTNPPSNVAPVALFTASPANGTAPVTVQFDASTSTDADGSIANYDWDFGDNSPVGSGVVVSHVYQASGTYTASLTVTDNLGATGSASRTVTVSGVLVPNVVDLTQSAAEAALGNAGLAVGDIASAASGTIPAGNIISQNPVAGSTVIRGASISLVISSGPGSSPPPTMISVPSVIGLTQAVAATTIANARLTIGAVTSGASAAIPSGSVISQNPIAGNLVSPGAPVSLVISSGPGLPPENRRPAASFAASPSSGEAPLTVQFDGSASTDADGSIVAYSWSFGDGSAGGTGVTVNHVYQAAGTYTVTLLVTDDQGATDSTSLPLVVTSAAPNVRPVAALSASPSGGEAPLTVQFDGSVSTDADGSIVAYSWNFGDGSTGGTGVSVVHVYQAAATYTVTLLVTDDQGATDSTSLPLVVTSAPPNVRPVAALSASPSGGEAPLTVQFDGSASTDADGSIVAYNWSFGDGSADATGVTVGHIYQAPGTYTATLTVTDNRSTTDTTSREITVEAASTDAVFQKSVISGADDAEENVATKAVRVGSTTLQLIRDSADQVVGLRFTNIPLSNLDFVTRAYIQFTVADNQNADTGALTIRGQAVDAAPAFSAAAGNLSSRITTTESVTWKPPDWSNVGDASVNQRTNDLSAILQEVIARPGWQAENSLVFIISGTSGYRRVAAAYESGAARAPRLHIEYRRTYYGNLHNHTAYSDGVSTPDQHYSDAKRSGLDFLGITDHDYALSNAEWTALKAAAINNSSSGFVAFHGFEWSSITAGDVAVINTDDFTTASNPATDNFAELMTWLSDRAGAVATYNHPGDIPADALCRIFSVPASPKFVGIELWNKTSGFSRYYDGDGCYLGGDGGKGYFDEALQRGWSVGAAGARDMHMEFIDTITSQNYADPPYRMGVWIPRLDKGSLVTGLQQRAFFSSMDANLRLWFDLGGRPMGSVVGAGTGTATIFALDATVPTPNMPEGDKFSIVELVKGNRTDAPLVVTRWYPDGRSFRMTQSVNGTAGDYFYVRVTQTDGGRAISSPIWIQ